MSCPPICPYYHQLFLLCSISTLSCSGWGSFLLSEHFGLYLDQFHHDFYCVCGLPIFNGVMETQTKIV
uniref:Uncharacterized protein n=1 Tax=Anguilla anguilla TaxID=7936 RepID=A0A0E9V4Q2_ANGAN